MMYLVFVLLFVSRLSVVWYLGKAALRKYSIPLEFSLIFCTALKSGLYSLNGKKMFRGGMGSRGRSMFYFHNTPDLRECLVLIKSKHVVIKLLCPCVLASNRH